MYPKRVYKCKCPTKKKPKCIGQRVGTVRSASQVLKALAFINNPQSCRDDGPSKRRRHRRHRIKKDRACMGMDPSMHARLQFIRHCPLKSPRPGGCGGMVYDSPDQAAARRQQLAAYKKTSCPALLKDPGPNDIMMTVPVRQMVHTTSNTSIVHVNSPKLSGEVIPVERAHVKPHQMKPPLPPDAAYDLYRPHSGIVINETADFAPEGLAWSPPPVLRKRRPSRPCHKGGICTNRRCPRKRCRKRGKILRKRIQSMNQQGDRDDDDTCGPDDLPVQEMVPYPQHLKRGALQTHSLTTMMCKKDRKPYRYGILQGSFNMYDQKFGPKSRGKQAIPMSIMAYCLAFHYHPKQWNTNFVDNLLDAGDKWYTQCLEKVHDHSDVLGICEVIQFGKKQPLNLNGKKMQILLGEPDIVGYTMSQDPTVYNLCRGLKAFFKMNRAGILLTKVFKVVVWKDKYCYYVFDPAGRDARAFSNFTTGTASLINVKDLSCLSEVLLARTIVEDQKYVLAPLKVLKMIDESVDEDIESDPELTQAEKAMMGFRILNESCAIVNANMHLGDKSFEDARFKQALPMSIVAMTYSKISPPNTWHSKTLDKILRLGNKLYMDCADPRVMVDISIDNIPNEIIMGPFSCEIIIYRDRVKGQLFTQKECIFNIQTGMDDFFTHGYNSGILEFNNYAVGFWRQKDMFYLFDPYPRTNDGQRAVNSGRACTYMLINTETMASVFTENWDYLPPTTQFFVHAFKVLKLKKKEPKMKIMCKLSTDELPKRKVSRKVLCTAKGRGDSRDSFRSLVPPDNIKDLKPKLIDEEKMADITSLVDSILEDYVPKIPLRYKNMVSEPMLPKVANLDSPCVSVTQVIPPWPQPRDKRGEPIDPDPEYEPTPPPTPPPAPPAEGAEEEEEGEEDEGKKKGANKIVEVVEDLPSPLPPPPPSPQNEPELAPPDITDEIETLEPVKATRKVLLAADARKRYKLRQMRKNTTLPLVEAPQTCEVSPAVELEKPHNFKGLPDGTQIIKGKNSISGEKTPDVLPFAAIMAIVTSYKYNISTWSPSIVTFVVDTAKKLYDNKMGKFQYSPVHVIPKITIGQQAYKANIDIVAEGSTWNLENVLIKQFLPLHDRGMVTTYNYSCAFFYKNGLYYLFDASTCDAMGLRRECKGKACFMRFDSLHELVSRILYNKSGGAQDHQYILSRIIVRRLLVEPRMKLPPDYDYHTGQSKGMPKPAPKPKFLDDPPIEDTCKPKVGYRRIGCIHTLPGTIKLPQKCQTGIKCCHYISLVAMLMATLHPIRTWDHVMVDTCVEKGLEIHKRAGSTDSKCERRVIRNLMLDGKVININIKKLTVVNENPDRTIDQYIKAVMARLRFVIISYPECSMVICNMEGYYHLFDPYASPASWTLYTTVEKLIDQIKYLVASPHNPVFYTYELTSIKTAPRYMQVAYKLSPLFKPHPNTLTCYTPKKPRPLMDEKVYWLKVCRIPWGRMLPTNDLGIKRKTPKSMCKEWDIEYPEDLYSLWGTLHPKTYGWHTGKQYLATSVLAVAMARMCTFDAWTSRLLDGIVEAGDIYHGQCVEKIQNKQNVELTPEDLNSTFTDMYPYKFDLKFKKVVFGFIYNILPDRFNLSKSLAYFFENYTHGILVSPKNNLGFGRQGGSYFLFDCQSFGQPIFAPGKGSAYVLRCMSLNRLIYCMTFALNCRCHGQQFYLYSVEVNAKELNAPTSRTSSRQSSSTNVDSRRSSKASVANSRASSPSSIDKGSKKSSKSFTSKSSNEEGG